MKRFCLIDFETASSCDLKKAGAYRYAEDPTTEILCLGYTFGDAGKVISGRQLLAMHGPQDLYDAVHDEECIFVAHNAQFEKQIWRKIMMALGWPDIPNERWHDIMAACAMKGLPLRLERAALALGLDKQKDMEGSRVTLSLSRPNRAGYYDRSPEKLERVSQYNLTDLGTELSLHRRVRGLGESERQTWLLDQRINERGVRLDREFIEASQQIVDDASRPLGDEFRKLTGGINPTQRDKFIHWLHDNGCPIANLQKDTIDKFLGDDDDEDDGSLAGDAEDYLEEKPQLILPFNFDRALRIRKVLGSASIKKLAAMRACINEDGRARGLLQYHGASTGRWAGRLFQPQNFPRPSLRVDGDPPAQDDVIGAIMSRDHEYVETMFGNPIEVVAHGLRHAIIANPGEVLTVGDFAKIECVIVLALAGATETAERVIKMGSAVYTTMAESIFLHPVKKTDFKEYTIGKNSVLGCGFQMGWKKFKKRYWNDATDDQAKEAIRIYREDFAPEVPELWYALERAAVDTVWTGHAHMAYGVVFALEDGWLTARLPSGRKLWYRSPVRVRKAMPWDPTDVRPGFEFMAWKQGQWKRISAYGGLLTENVVQALARDLLRDRLLILERDYSPLVLTVHDEAVTEGVRNDVAAFKQIMTERPLWATGVGIPVDADCWSADRYRK